MLTPTQYTRNMCNFEKKFDQIDEKESINESPLENSRTPYITKSWRESGILIITLRKNRESR